LGSGIQSQVSELELRTYGEHSMIRGVHQTAIFTLSCRCGTEAAEEGIGGGIGIHR
jgi:hypothetical protein